MTDSALLPINHLTFESASEHVRQRVPITTAQSWAGDLRRSLAGKQYDNATHIAVCHDGKLIGVLRIEDLLSAAENTAISSLMDSSPPMVAPGTDQEVAVWRAIQHDETALAVVGNEGRFIGFVPPQRLIAVLLWEHEEDMTRLGNYLHDTSAARSASLERIARRFLHRIPWLLLGLVGALLAADIVGAFEERLQEMVTWRFSSLVSSISRMRWGHPDRDADRAWPLCRRQSRKDHTAGGCDGRFDRGSAVAGVLPNGTLALRRQ